MGVIGKCRQATTFLTPKIGKSILKRNTSAYQSPKALPNFANFLRQ